MKPLAPPAGDAEADHSAHLLRLIEILYREVHPGRAPPPISLESRLTEDLGFDSLGRTELLLRVEREFSVSLPAETLAGVETAADLWRAIEAAAPRRERRIAQSATAALPGPVESIPRDAGTLTETLDWQAAVHPDRTHVWLTEREGECETISYAQLRERALAVAGGLLEAGLTPGARVALMLPTCAGFLHAFIGILYAGCIPVPIYPPARLSQLEDHLRRQAAILANAEAELLITVREGLALAHFLRSTVESMRSIETVDSLVAAGGSERGPTRTRKTWPLFNTPPAARGIPKAWC